VLETVWPEVTECHALAGEPQFSLGARLHDVAVVADDGEFGGMERPADRDARTLDIGAIDPVGHGERRALGRSVAVEDLAGRRGRRQRHADGVGTQCLASDGQATQSPEHRGITNDVHVEQRGREERPRHTGAFEEGAQSAGVEQIGLVDHHDRRPVPQ